MQFQSKVKVLGASMFKDSVDGTAYDFTKLFIEMPLDESTGRAKGFSSQEIRWGLSDEFAKISHLPFPFEAEVTIELVTSGKSQKQRVISLVPRAAVKGAQA